MSTIRSAVAGAITGALMGCCCSLSFATAQEDSVRIERAGENAPAV